MKIIHINASTAYDVVIGSGIVNDFSAYVKVDAPNQKAVIISDEHVWPLYGTNITEQLSSCGFDVYSYVIKAGEQYKSLSSFEQIAEFLTMNHVTRSDILVALGGGVIGDLTGFVAATYLRGISYIQIPTTVLSMVDSSVGGKTAVNLTTGKNLIGAFHPPKIVLCDIHHLSSLPNDIFREGCAEIIKYGILFDPQLFQHLEDYTLCFDREYVISRCVELKRNVVERDEFDNGQRQQLNLGHTVGHGIESLSQFQVSHGNAVAIGMHIIANAACYAGLCDPEDSQRIYALLIKFGFNLHQPYSVRELLQEILKDKKRNGNFLNLIIPIRIGVCQVSQTPIYELESILEAGLSLWTY